MGTMIGARRNWRSLTLCSEGLTQTCDFQVRFVCCRPPFLASGKAHLAATTTHVLRALVAGQRVSSRFYSQKAIPNGYVREDMIYGDHDLNGSPPKRFLIQVACPRTDGLIRGLCLRGPACSLTAQRNNFARLRGEMNQFAKER